MIYVASSWRNKRQPEVVEYLRAAGNEVYDFRNPSEDNDGFAWSDIDPDWEKWDVVQYRKALNDPIASEGYGYDKRALDKATLGVLVLPCGRSAHLEAGYMVGQGKRVFILLEEVSFVGVESIELMYKLAHGIGTKISEAISWARCERRIGGR